MHAMIRSYSGKGAAEMLDLLVEKKDEVRALLTGVAGLMSYDVLRTGDGWTTVTVCRDQAGAEESLKLAKEFTQANTLGSALRPTIHEGVVVLHIGTQRTGRPPERVTERGVGQTLLPSAAPKAGMKGAWAKMHGVKTDVT